MKKILLSLSVVSFLCAGNFGDFDGFDDRFDRFMNGPKKTKESKKDKEKSEQKATEKEEKADEKKSEKDSKKDKEADVKNITRSFDRGWSSHPAYIEYEFDSDGNLSSIVYSLDANIMYRSDVGYKSLALNEKLPSAIRGTLHNNGELMTLKTLISATNKAGANKAMDNLKAQLGNVLPLLKDYNSIEVVEESYNDVERAYHLKIKVIDDIIKKAKAQAK